MVFTNIKLPRSEFPQRGSKFYLKTLIKMVSGIQMKNKVVGPICIKKDTLKYAMN